MDGFEKGMMERENDDVFYDAGCEIVDSENRDLALVQRIADGYKAFMSVVKQDNPMSKMFNTVTYFIENLG